MSITNPSVIANGYDVTNLADYITNAGTAVNPWSGVLSADRWYVFIVHSYRTSGAALPLAVAHDLSGTRLDFALISDGTTVASQTNGLHDFSAWAVKPSADTASAPITIDYAASHSAAGWTLLEYPAGVDPTSPWRQVVKATGTSLSAAVTMASFGATDNATLLLAECLATGRTFTPTEGRSELAENDETERADHAVDHQNPNGGDTTLNMTISGASVAWTAIGIEVVAAAGGGNTDLLGGALAGSYAISGQADGEEWAHLLAGGAAPASYAVSGADDSSAHGYALAGGALAGAYAVAGFAATTLVGRVLLAGALAGSYAIGGQAITEARDVPEPANAGAYAIAGADASTAKAGGLNAYELTGGALPGSYAITGAADGQLWTHLLAGGALPGSYSVQGAADGQLLGRVLAGGALLGSYAIAGTPDGEEWAHLLAAGALPGSYAIAGPPDGQLWGRVLAAGALPGAIALTGADATTAKGTPGNTDLLGGAVAGSYAITGAADAQLWVHLLAGGALPAAYAIAGLPSSEAIARILAGGALPGSYAIGGAAATLLAAYALAAQAGSYGLTGEDAALISLAARLAVDYWNDAQTRALDNVDRQTRRLDPSASHRGWTHRATLSGAHDMPPVKSVVINAYVGGDDLSLERPVEDLPTGRTIVKAWLTIKAKPKDTDLQALVQKVITTSAQGGVGQILDAGSGGVGLLLFLLTPNDTQTLLTPGTRYHFDVQIKLDDGEIVTLETSTPNGYIQFEQGVTSASS